MDIEDAYPRNTLRAFRADFEEFLRFCEKRGAKALPAKPKIVAHFIYWACLQKLASASIRRKIVSIGSIHRLSGLPDPTKAGCVKLSTRKMNHKLGCACKQAAAITKDMLQRMLEVCANEKPRED